VETFDIIYPSKELSPYIRYYWTLRIDQPIPVSERIIPTGCISLTFHRADHLYSLSYDGMQPEAFVCGMSDNYTDLRTTGSLDMITVVFQPFGAKAFFPMPVSEFNNNTVPIHALSNVSLQTLQSRILDCADNHTAIRHIENYLIKQLSRNQDYNYRRMFVAIDSLNRFPQISVRELSETTCLSYKQFNRIFNEYIGAPPKEFSRIIRFQRVLHLMQTRPGLNFTQLSLDSGYYDQPHLNREFKLFSGYSPSEYLSICPPYSDYFSTI